MLAVSGEERLTRLTRGAFIVMATWR